jgi:hypothetical protein
MSDLDYYDPLADERSYLPDGGETAASLNARAEALNLARVQPPPPEKLLAEKIASLRLDITVLESAAFTGQWQLDNARAELARLEALQLSSLRKQS